MTEPSSPLENRPTKIDGTGSQPSARPADELKATILFRPEDIASGQDSALRATLEVVTGEANRKALVLGADPVRIGRASSNDLVLSDDRASRTHAEVRIEDGHYVIEDLNSSNGVRVDDQKVQTAVLRPDCRIGLGDTVLVFRQPQTEISQEERVRLLSKSDVLDTLDAEAKTALAQAMSVRFCPRGTVIVQQGTPIESALFVASGVVRVVAINDEGGERDVDRLAAGDCFGERALVAGAAAGQSLIAGADACILSLRKETLAKYLQKQPHTSQILVGTVRMKLKTAQIRTAEPTAKRADLDDVVTSTQVEIVGDDTKIQRLKVKIEALAKEDVTALIVGPQGAGKKTFARYYHNAGPRKQQAYVEISAADQLPGGIGAAVFGVETGGEAAKDQVGYLELLGDGTLAIQHAELLDAHQQALLAAYLKLGWFHRVNGQQAVKTATKVIFLATGSEQEITEWLVPELKELVAKRIGVVPPLTQRLKDIPLLAEYYLKDHARRAGRKSSGLSREASDRLVSYAWPGNVSELRNVMERAAIVTSEDAIIPGDLIFVAPPERDVHKINILRNEKVRNLLRDPRLMRSFIWVNIAFVGVVTAFTLWGGTRPAGHPLQEFANNPGMLITWLIWFPLLPVSAFLIGRIWCGICPIAGIGDLAAKFKRHNLAVPKIFKRLDFWMVIASFILVDYIEELAGVADKPLATAIFLIVIVYLAIAFTILYERKTFCRYLCPLASVLGAYSSMSVFEVRGNKKVCQTQCGEHTCYKGSDKAEGCPLSAYPASINTNAECMMCANCLKSCENRGVQVNVRPPLQELWRNAQPMFAMSIFAVILVGLMAKHQFPKLTRWITAQQSLGWSDGTAHTILFVLFMAGAVVAFALSSTLSAAASQEKVAQNMTRYGIAFIPLAFSGHLAHVTHEFLGDGIYALQGYLVMVWDKFTKGIAIGSQAVTIAPWVNSGVLTFLKFVIVTGGFVGSAIALMMIARRLSEKTVFARAMPHLMLLAVLWIGYVTIFTGSTDAPPTGPAATPPVAAAPAPLASSPIVAARGARGARP